MAHLFMLPPHIPLTTTATASTNSHRRRPSVPQQHQSPPQAQAQFQDENLIDLSDPRTGSMSFSDSCHPPSPSETGYNPAARRNSALAAHRNPSISSQQHIRTRSVGGAVIPERSPDDDDDIIIVTVRLTNNFRKSSISSEACTELPSRPPRRGFLRRMTTRINSGWDHSAEKEERYKAVKMPRGEYKRYFARDREGDYAGSEEEREWNEEELMGRYGLYQEMPLSRVVC